MAEAAASWWEKWGKQLKKIKRHHSTHGSCRRHDCRSVNAFLTFIQVPWILRVPHARPRRDLNGHYFSYSSFVSLRRLHVQRAWWHSIATNPSTTRPSIHPGVELSGREKPLFDGCTLPFPALQDHRRTHCRWGTFSTTHGPVPSHFREESTLVVGKRSHNALFLKGMF